MEYSLFLGSSPRWNHLPRTPAQSRVLCLGRLIIKIGITWGTFSSWSEIFGPSDIFQKNRGNLPRLKMSSRIVRFLCPAARWTRADVYFPKHREFLQTFRQVWSYIDFAAARCERPEHFWSWDVFPVYFLYIIFRFFSYIDDLLCQIPCKNTRKYWNNEIGIIGEIMMMTSWNFTQRLQTTITSYVESLKLIG